MGYPSTVSVKQETLEPTDHARILFPTPIQMMIRTDFDDEGESAPKKARLSAEGILGYSQSPEMEIECPEPLATYVPTPERKTGCRQFWKAGDFEANPGDVINAEFFSVGMDHVRVHPKFLHSNATSHNWALGAFAELLDNSVDEICNGATYVNLDMLKNEKNGSNMLLVEDDGGGMTPENMRNCMSLGYSSKSKKANTIGQYGNGFKTSTMRLGADAIVFSRCQGNNNTRGTQTIGMLSYTFLRSTGKEDIVVPMVDYEKTEQDWKMIASPNYVENWNRNLVTIAEWSPYFNEEHLLQQFDFVKDHGTRVIIYNLWEDDQGLLELDVDADPFDIQIRGVNRDETKIRMANQYPNSRHYLTYHHSFRSYASILYLRLPPMFKMILRGKEIEHHSVEDDMMLTKKMTYRPMLDGMVTKDSNISADVTVGFVKDARYHIDVQGFNVYHKNRLIKPFWRVWNAAGSNGRGVVDKFFPFWVGVYGVLEANFVEPAHDKQGFERTTVLSRLEQRLVALQKSYWSSNCQKVGYVGNVSRRTSLKKSRSKTDGNSSGEGSRATTTQPQRGVISEQRGMANGDEQPIVVNLVNKIECEKERGQSLEANLKMVEQKLQELDEEQLTLIDMLDEERKQRDEKEGRLVTKLNEAYKTIDDLRERIRQLEAVTGLICCKEEQ